MNPAVVVMVDRRIKNILAVNLSVALQPKDVHLGAPAIRSGCKPLKYLHCTYMAADCESGTCLQFCSSISDVNCCFVTNRCKEIYKLLAQLYPTPPNVPQHFHSHLDKSVAISQHSV